MKEKIILTIQEADKILHDVKVAISDIAKACQPFLDFTDKLHDAISKLSDAQDRLYKAIDSLNYRKKIEEIKDWGVGGV